LCKSCGPVRASDRAGVIERLASERHLLEDGQILWDKAVGTFHLLVRVRRDAHVDPDPEGLRKTVVALDPGCRAFNTYYDSSGRHGELLVEADAEIVKRCQTIDALCSKVSKLAKDRSKPKRKRQRRRRTARKALARRRNSLRNWIKNAHYDAANFLLLRYDVVLAPTFAVKDMAKQNQRVFRSKTARSMYNWSHYAFRQRLKSKAYAYVGRVVIEIGGAWHF
jgi:putative transposase